MPELEQPARRGRPPVPEDQRQAEVVGIRLTAAQRDKLKALGGAAWLRERIDRAKSPEGK